MGEHEIPPSNKGYKMLTSMGWKAGEGLGAEKQGRKAPVPTCFKRDRAGLGKKNLPLHVTHTSVVTVVTKPTPPPQPKLTAFEKRQLQQEKEAMEKKHTSFARDLYGDMADGYEEYFQ
ncbi:hypothetical protein H310_14095 [Aphanomyces invadans]|uniref:G-patch domain-containing protein n=1 Tax=Aphanomyces invadans TaxID=157072 RepID=A0A024TAQ6_9STRA|nr:hypothetical protein H310_14095 [Aphanomyces invadans]ETV91230.1 hypothetical protein H310_14095 [Aphanomyces invadans]|eukprot:XP_008880067.1 hypothetical protein H310_14095 [Aphanomyces invadans]